MNAGSRAEEHWKLRYLRSTRPDLVAEDACAGEPLHVLFVCSRNQWRSPTAEEVWRRHPDLRVRSAGTSASARRRVTEADLRWAHAIFAMESRHKARLLADHAQLIGATPIHVLDIPDEYQRMDSELVELLRISVAAALGLPVDGEGQ
jgi:predicted protein tyrosine phosphatase